MSQHDGPDQNNTLVLRILVEHQHTDGPGREFCTDLSCQTGRASIGEVFFSLRYKNT